MRDYKAKSVVVSWGIARNLAMYRVVFVVDREIIPFRLVSR